MLWPVGHVAHDIVRYRRRKQIVQSLRENPPWRRALLFVFAAGTTAGAQARPDTLPTVRDSIRHGAAAHGSAPACGVSHHAMMAALYRVVIAPGGLLCLAMPDSQPDDGRRLAFARDHLRLYVSGGPISAGTDTDDVYSTWASLAAAELLVNTFLLEARIERFLMPDELTYASIRVGRLSRRFRTITGGATIGYRDVRGARPHDGIEIAFPFVTGGPGGWVRLETAYVFSNTQSSWNYRIQWDRLQGNGPVFLGLRLDLNSREMSRKGRLSHGVFGVVLGTTWSPDRD